MTDELNLVMACFLFKFEHLYEQQEVQYDDEELKFPRARCLGLGFYLRCDENEPANDTVVLIPSEAEGDE